MEKIKKIYTGIAVNGRVVRGELSYGGTFDFRYPLIGDFIVHESTVKFMGSFTEKEIDVPEKKEMTMGDNFPAQSGSECLGCVSLRDDINEDGFCENCLELGIDNEYFETLKK